jgi:hypothetical protein
MTPEDFLHTKGMLLGALSEIEKKIKERAEFLRNEYCKDPATPDEWYQYLILYRELQDIDPVLKELNDLHQRTSIWFFKTVDEYNGKYSNPRDHARIAFWRKLQRN